MDTWRGKGYLCHYSSILYDAYRAGKNIEKLNNEKRQQKQDEAEERLRKSQRELYDKKRQDAEAANYAQERQNNRNAKSGYKTSQQKSLDNMSDMQKIANRIDNIIETNGKQTKDDYVAKIQSRADNNLSPIEWMTFTEYFRADMDELFDRRGLGYDTRTPWVKDRVDLHRRELYDAEVDRKVKSIMQRKKEQLIRNAQGKTPEERAWNDARRAVGRYPSKIKGQNRF